MATLKARHATAMQFFAHISHDSDAGVAAGLRAVHERTSASHSLGHGSRSLIRLIKDHLDTPVHAMMGNEGYRMPAMSELVVMESGVAETVLVDIATDSLGGGDFALSTPFSSSCDDLITFLTFCAEHQPDRVRAARFPEADDLPHIARSVRLGIRSSRQKPPAPAYLASIFAEFQRAGLCLACGQPVQEREERERLLNDALDKELADFLRSGGQFTSAGRGSRTYCGRHAEKSAASTGAKQARTMKTQMLSLVRALRRREITPLLNPLFPPSFDLRFATLAMAQRENRRDLALIAAALPAMLEWAEEFDEEERRNAAEQIRNAVVRIFDRLQLQPKPYTPALATQPGPIFLDLSTVLSGRCRSLWNRIPGEEALAARPA